MSRLKPRSAPPRCGQRNRPDPYPSAARVRRRNSVRIEKQHIQVVSGNSTSGFARTICRSRKMIPLRSWSHARWRTETGRRDFVIAIARRRGTDRGRSPEERSWTCMPMWTSQYLSRVSLQGRLHCTTYNRRTSPILPDKRGSLHKSPVCLRRGPVRSESPGPPAKCRTWSRLKSGRLFRLVPGNVQIPQPVFCQNGPWIVGTLGL